ncbi:MAG: hypothetical protein M3Q23_10410 [Actinomycetota bacterium]|nr:hypothetical protein [Actinomycetota bacterium]
MTALRRTLTIAEMQGRDLGRRRLSLLLLIALPLSFYGAMAGHQTDAVIPGAIAMAFSVAGAAIFSVLSSRRVDQRLVIMGYRPGELLVGRLVCLAVLSVPIVAGSAALMAAVSGPPRPWIFGLGVAMVAVVALPFGLAVGSLVPRELEATLVLIGVVGIQLSLSSSDALAKALPFYGAERLIDISLGDTSSVWAMVAVSLLYAAALLVVSLLLMARRVRVRRNDHPAGDIALGSPSGEV